MPDPLLNIGTRITALPVVHGSGDFAWEVRRFMLSHSFDCLAVPLPASFQQLTEQSILDFPSPGIVVQPEGSEWGTPWQPASRTPASDIDGCADLDGYASYVPIDPCQPVIAAVRTALGDRLPRFFIDLETDCFEPYSRSFPDAFALKQLTIQQYAAAILPFLTRPQNEQWFGRVRYMAARLRELSMDYQRILFVVNILDWPWVREAYFDTELEVPENPEVNDCQRYCVDRQSYYFLLGEIPFITQLYEQARATLEDDERLSVDGVKELLLSARSRYFREYRNQARRITPRTLALCLKYIRNLTLIEHGLSPQLITMVTAAKQIVGDGFALSVLEQAKEYSCPDPNEFPEMHLGIDRARVPDGDVWGMKNRLPGPPLLWTQLQLAPKPDDSQRAQWRQQWNPFSQCSWPPEDELIENFRQTVFDRALETMGTDLIRTEKFDTSVRDGIDIRDTIRNWHTGEIFVRILPPNRGVLDCAVMLFDSPADPRDYPWRTTWFAEHQDESTLCFYATPFLDQPVGPGICLATYGGVMFLYPPVAIRDIWSDPRLDFATTLEERLLAAACVYSRSSSIALVAPSPPGQAWKQMARRFKKKWVYLPLARFSDSTIQQLRMVHVLNGKQIRSFAANFIRRV